MGFADLIKKKVRNKPDYKEELGGLREELSYLKTKGQVQKTKGAIKKMKWEQSGLGKLAGGLAAAGKTYGKRRGGSSIFDNAGFGGLDEFKTKKKVSTRKGKKQKGTTITVNGTTITIGKKKSSRPRKKKRTTVYDMM